jgi:hypothetical protein
MPTTNASRTQLTGQDHWVNTERPLPPEESKFLGRLAEAVLEIPPFTPVYCSSANGFGVLGLLKSVSRGGLQVLVPLSLPLGDVVQVTIGEGRVVLGKVLYSVRRSTIYQVGIVFSSRHELEIPVGCLAVIRSLDEPSTRTRGNVVDVGSSRLSIFCKTMLVPGAWVRVEANGWLLFGLVEAVVATSMLACCVDIHLEAACHAASTALETADSIPPGIDETANATRLSGRKAARELMIATTA